ncbi:hypothetical protein PHYSODRAFT_284664 [Phytophthora sojae]|uniref:RxLR effector protein n=2 Tax=Phytophthora sojae TaxID=67593 RepID=G4YRD8_PHYSP|nr:hypothetical protein PHYSODRAFT_284664 [Phytophthora sojae]AEK80982.1 Avh229 [Phytophthora sojae]AEK80983.1 Avh229 [Phytophthora sojae]EGZ22872.1 hypothetical protein PHYSODRAFT_284664 [Phytophthora sojae]|eukprot:XP_009518160.1 hypothetical protein PHYSODRAFT_284664 [Phytophthora sojae]
MQFGFFLLLIAAAVLTSCEVASASADVAATLSKTTSSYLFADAPDAAGKGSRFLRSDVAEDAKRNNQLGEEERANAFTEYLKTIMAKLLGNPKKADLTRTFPSPPKADVLQRSKSFSGRNAEVQKLTRSKSLSSLKSNPNLEQAADEVLLAAATNVVKHFDTFIGRRQDPDAMFRHFKLDPRVARAGTVSDDTLLDAAKGNPEVLGQYVLWNEYLAFYKEKYPKWVSMLK